MSYSWQYLGSLTPGQTSLYVNGQLMTPTPVASLPGSPTLGTLVAVLQDASTGLRWAMLFA